MTDHSKLLEVAIAAARIGGDVLMNNLDRLHDLKIDRKAEADFVSDVDRQSEKAILAHIFNNFPDHRVLAEEGGFSGERASAVEWVVDPLDGTTNYIEGVPHFAVSIAARRAGEIIVGAVWDPIRREMFSASKGRGAFLNDKKILVSPVATLREALIGTGFPFRAKQLSSAYIDMFADFFENVRDIRRMGVASIDLAYVAAGRYDGFWEYRLSQWDIAAGVLLVQEAGGRCSSFHSQEDLWQTGSIIASNGHLHEAMAAIVAAHHQH